MNSLKNEVYYKSHEGTGARVQRHTMAVKMERVIHGVIEDIESPLGYQVWDQVRIPVQDQAYEECG